MPSLAGAVGRKSVSQQEEGEEDWISDPALQVGLLFTQVLDNCFLTFEEEASRL